MFRLPPTSIGLSQNDLDTQLQQIDIYVELLKQGFKKKEITRYLKDQNQSSASRPQEDSLLERLSSAPSILALSLRNGDSEDFPTTLEAESDSAAKSRPESEHEIPSSSLVEGQCTLDDIRYDRQATASPEVQLPPLTRTEHAPRHSSLLRFTQTASSETNSVELHSPLSCSRNDNIRYRPRTNTYSYEQSDIDSTSSSEVAKLADVSQNLEHLILSNELLPLPQANRIISPKSSTLSPEAQEFSPLQLPPPHVESTSNNLDALAVQLDACDMFDSTSASSTLRTPKLVASFTKNEKVRSASVEPASSSPLILPQRKKQVVDGQDDLIARFPATPHLTGKACSVRTRKHRQYFDGAFTVYNDELPPQEQPQTPADLRHDQINIYTASYTAPPGMVRSETLQRNHPSQRLRQLSEEQSPTRRAITMRDRRHREFLRGVHVEALRVGRRLRLSAVRNSDDTGGLELRTGEQELNSWREELDADRVGEENFDDIGLNAAFAHGMRVVSGNRRGT